MTDKTVAAHTQTHASNYIVHYPEHGARANDPHYKDFNHLHKVQKNDPELYQCAVGKRRGDFSDCTLVDSQGKTIPLEMHHQHIEFAVMNAVDLKMMAKQYPGIDTPDEVGAWTESAENLEWLCRFHHRGHGGAHVASASDFEGQHFVKGLIS